MQMAQYENAFYHTFRRNAVAPPVTIARYSANTTTLTTSTTVEVNQPFYFTLDSVAGYTDFTSLYDQYRIVGVDVECFPPNDSLTSGALVVSTDYDDATSTNVASLLQYAAAKRFPVGKPIFLRVDKPSVDVTVFGTGGAAPGVNAISPWLDCGKPDVQHYGLKFAATVTGNATVYTIMFRYRLQFRYVR